MIKLCVILLGLQLGLAIPSWAQESLATKVDQAIEKIASRPLRSDHDTPWVILHAVIAFENSARVYDTQAQESVDAIDFLLTRARFDGRRIFRDRAGVPALPTRGLSYGLKESFLVQDHVDQYLMALADAGVAPDRELISEGGRRFRVADLLAAAQREFRGDQELGWTLVAFSTYLSFEEKWTHKPAPELAAPDLVALAIERDANRETEGGPHHLYGIAYALERGRRAGLPLEGPWRGARDYLEQHVRKARLHQQQDGNFSSDMFRGSRPPQNPSQAVWATGHTLEWLTLALKSDELRADWVQRAVARLADTILGVRLGRIRKGALYHAAHALRLYRDRVLGKP